MPPFLSWDRKKRHASIFSCSGRSIHVWTSARNARWWVPSLSSAFFMANCLPVVWLRTRYTFPMPPCPRTRSTPKSSRIVLSDLHSPETLLCISSLTDPLLLWWEQSRVLSQFDCCYQHAWSIGALSALPVLRRFVVLSGFKHEQY